MQTRRAGYVIVSLQDVPNVPALDLAEGTGPYPAIIFIFGGGWNSGGRIAFREHIQWAAEKGYVGVAMDYRLLNRMEAGEFLYPFPAQIQDPKCAVQWLRANAEEYKIDQDRIGAVGIGSGSHLTLLLALTDESDGLEGDCDFADYSSRIQAAVGIAGPIELTSHYAMGKGVKGYVSNLCGGTPDEVPEAYERASPITYVSGDDPPVLTIFGELDEMAMPYQGELMKARTEEYGIHHELVVLEGKNHVKLGLLLGESYDLAYDFFDEFLK